MFSCFSAPDILHKRKHEFCRSVFRRFSYLSLSLSCFPSAYVKIGTHIDAATRMWERLECVDAEAAAYGESARRECKRWRFMWDYAKCGLLSPLSPAFRGTTSVSAVGAMYKSAPRMPRAYWDLPCSHGTGEKIAIRGGDVDNAAACVRFVSLNAFSSLSAFTLRALAHRAIRTNSRL